MRTLRRLLIAWVLAAVAVPAGAQAHPCCSGTSYWSHQHTRYYYFYNGVDGDDYWRQATRDAQVDWDTSVRIELPTHAHDGSRLHPIDSKYGNTGWCGTAEVAYHPSWNHVRLNDSYIGTCNRRATVCQELGHGVGEDHHSGDCMGYSYFSGWSSYPGQHSVDDLNSYYANPPDGSASH
jgi:hypothetical protein